MERTAEYTISCIGRILEECDMREAVGICFWFDAGPHFRNYKVLGYIGCQLTQKHKIPTRARFGCEHHFKMGSKVGIE